MKSRCRLEILSFFVLLLALALPRLWGIARFATPDEELWLTRSANFYYALTHRDFAATFQKSHPGVTVMWVGACGFQSVYPNFRETKLGQIGSRRLYIFLEKRAPDLPLQILAAARRTMVVLQVGLLVLAFLFARRLFGALPAWIGFLLIAFDPFHLGLSRLLHLDALLADLMLVSFLAFLAFLSEQRSLDLVISGCAAGMAWLTKSPGLFLIPLISLVAFFDLLHHLRLTEWVGRLRLVGGYAWMLAAWGGVAVLVLFLFWPALWVDPLGSLGQVISDAWGYAEGGPGTPLFYNGQIYPEGEIHELSFYPVNFLWRTTPITLLGLVGLALAFVRQHRQVEAIPPRQAGAGLLLLALGFMLLMSLGDKKFDRYIIPSFLALDVLAGVGLAWLADQARRAWSVPPYAWLPAALITGLLAVQAELALREFPYYLTYYNPLLGGARRAAEVLQIGWGEGLDQAARYLNSRTDPENMKVAAWYAIGPFSYFSKSRIYDISPDQAWTERDQERFYQMDYAVVYIHQWQRDLPARLMAILKTKTPEHSIWINGLEYVRIYRLR